MSTLPKEAIEVLNQWVEKHALLLPSAVPMQYESNNNYSFDPNNALFSGPFSGDNWLKVE